MKNKLNIWVIVLILSLPVFAFGIEYTFTINGPADKLIEVLDGFVRYHGWVDGTPQEKRAFAKKVLRKYIVRDYRRYIQKTGIANARQAAITQAHDDTNGISVE